MVLALRLLKHLSTTISPTSLSVHVPATTTTSLSIKLGLSGLQQPILCQPPRSGLGTDRTGARQQCDQLFGHAEAADETPDTAVVFLGGNDIAWDSSVSAATVRDRIKVIIDKLQGDVEDSGNPNIRILLVSILPRFDVDGEGNYTRSGGAKHPLRSINALLEPLATDETTRTSEVTYLDLATTFNSAADVFYDEVHPNGNGEQIEADAIFGALVDLTPTYTITFINVDGTQTTQTVDENVVATPPTGVSTVDKTFTGWPTIAPATADATYYAAYTTGNASASVSVSVAQSATGLQGSTPIDLTAEGDLDWGAWDGEETVPGQTMDGGVGFTSLTAIDDTTFDGGSFYSQNLYSWTNGTPTAAGNTTFAAMPASATRGKVCD